MENDFQLNVFIRLYNIIASQRINVVLVIRLSGAGLLPLVSFWKTLCAPKFDPPTIHPKNHAPASPPLLEIVAVLKMSTASSTTLVPDSPSAALNLDVFILLLLDVTVLSTLTRVLFPAILVEFLVSLVPPLLSFRGGFRSAAVLPSHEVGARALQRHGTFGYNRERHGRVGDNYVNVLYFAPRCARATYCY